jgi:carboxypeptidase Taq
VSAPPALETLRSKLGEIHDLVKAGGLLGWDQQTIMPPRGAEVRAQQLGTIGKVAHEMFIADEVGNLLEELRPYGESLDYDTDDASLLRAVQRDYDKSTRVPPELSAEITRAGSRAFGAWVEAREKSDYESFRPYLEQMIELKHRYVDCFPVGDDPYDTLLDDYEPGMKTAQVRQIFDRLKEELIPLIEARPTPTPQVTGSFPAAKQRQLSLDIIRRFGYDESAWRIDAAPHPFASSLGTTDIRITTREPEDSLDGLFATMHETGHGLYENGVDPALERTPLARGASLGLHESQSRLWENLVGRSRPFWQWFYPHLQEAFPAELGSVDAETWLRSINDVSPGLIRIEADEATYNLHIILRFELEQRIMAGEIDPRDLPDAWNAAMKQYLGVDVPDDAHGVLQDVHWSRGVFGYFPTYSLGNVMSVQIWEKLREDVSDVDEQMARGEFGAIREWLRTHLHVLGRKYLPAETLERVVGGPIDPEPYLRYLKRKLSAA